jgi:hypothetical protein
MGKEHKKHRRKRKSRNTHVLLVFCIVLLVFLPRNVAPSENSPQVLQRRFLRVSNV